MQSEIGDCAKMPPAPPCNVSKPLDGSQSQGHRVLLIVHTYTHMRLNVFFPSVDFYSRKRRGVWYFPTPPAVDAI